jgi:hypothetical protein
MEAPLRRPTNHIHRSRRAHHGSPHVSANSVPFEKFGALTREGAVTGPIAGPSLMFGAFIAKRVWCCGWSRIFGW